MKCGCEAAEFAKLSGDLKANIAACDKAIAAISKGMSASFLQSGAAALRQLVLSTDKLDRYSRSVLTDFLSTKEGYAPASLHKFETQKLSRNLRRQRNFLETF